MDSGVPPAPLPSEAERRRPPLGRGGRLAELCERVTATSLGDSRAGGTPASPSGRGSLGLLWLLVGRRRDPSAPALAARRSVGTRRGWRGARGVPASSCSCFGGLVVEGLGDKGVSWLLAPLEEPSGSRERRLQRGRRPDSR